MKSTLILTLVHGLLVIALNLSTTQLFGISVKRVKKQNTECHGTVCVCVWKMDLNKNTLMRACVYIFSKSFPMIRGYSIAAQRHKAYLCLDFFPQFTHSHTEQILYILNQHDKKNTHTKCFKCPIGLTAKKPHSFILQCCNSLAFTAHVFVVGFSARLDLSHF